MERYWVYQQRGGSRRGGAPVVDPLTSGGQRLKMINTVGKNIKLV